MLLVQYCFDPSRSHQQGSNLEVGVELEFRLLIIQKGRGLFEQWDLKNNFCKVFLTIG